MKRLITLIGLSLLVFSISAISLDESVNLALKNNRNLLIAKEEVEKANMSYNDVRGTLLPQITLQGGYELSRTHLPPNAIPGEVNFMPGLSQTASMDDYYLAGALAGVVNNMIPTTPQDQASVALQVKMTQVLFLGGKLVNGIKAVDRYRSIQRLNYWVEEQNLILKTNELFYQCLLAEKLVQVQQDGLDMANQHLARVEAFFEEGMVSEFDLLRARLEVAKLEPQVLQAQNTYEIALSAFRMHLGSEDESLVPEGEFVLPEKMEVTLEEALSSGKEKRVELELLDIATEVAQIKYNAERGNYLPNIALTADYSLYTAADDFSIEKDDFGSRYSVGIGIQIPIFTGLSNTAKRNRARSEYLQAQYQQRDLENMIRLEVTQNWQNLQHTLHNHEVQSQNIRMAERSLEIAQARYDNQVGIQLEVFDARITLSGIRLQYLQSIYDIIIDQLKLTKSMGIKI
ncbi:MAG TPA: TolC family protein [Candidatus Cloacimonetes bacterium]|jgi:outer membrane protein|nr:TolC family protein [Candidatus Cloacimonadota bacterium]